MAGITESIGMVGLDAETRKMVLQGADGVVFVADSQRYMLDQNKDSIMDLKRNLNVELKQDGSSTIISGQTNSPTKTSAK